MEMNHDLSMCVERTGWQEFCRAYEVHSLKKWAVTLLLSINILVGGFLVFGSTMEVKSFQRSANAINMMCLSDQQIYLYTGDLELNHYVPMDFSERCIQTKDLLSESRANEIKGLEFICALMLTVMLTSLFFYWQKIIEMGENRTRICIGASVISLALLWMILLSKVGMVQKFVEAWNQPVEGHLSEYIIVQGTPFYQAFSGPVIALLMVEALVLAVSVFRHSGLFTKKENNGI